MRWLLVLFLILLWAMCAGVVFFLREIALWAKRDKDRAEEEARAAERDPYETPAYVTSSTAYEDNIIKALEDPAPITKEFLENLKTYTNTKKMLND